MIMIKKIDIYFFLLILCLSSCKDKKKVVIDENTYLMRNYIDSIGIKTEYRFYDDSVKLLLVYNENGNLIRLVNLPEHDKVEVLNFHPNGFLQSKLLVKEQDIKNGRSYYFYPSGVMSSQFHFRNDTLEQVGFEYYDTTGNVKGISTFDSLGNVVKSTHVMDPAELDNN